MTIEEKAKKLQKYCDKQDRCKECVLNSYKYKCGLFASWLDRNDLISDNDVEKAYNIVFGKEENEMNKEFTKSDLKTGMIVETREGIKYVVLLNACMFGDLIVNGNDLCWNGLSNYNDELIEHHGYNELDIVKVYKPKHPYTIHTFEEDALELIWEREEYKEMTIAEIEKELGYSIKIVKEKENE